MNNEMISEYNKKKKKDYKTWYDLVEKMIHKDLCEKFKYEHSKKWCLQNPESVPVVPVIIGMLDTVIKRLVPVLTDLVIRG